MTDRSIFEHVLAHLREDGPALLEGGETLPDEEELHGDEELSWAPGALAGVLARHAEAEEKGPDEPRADAVLAALLGLAGRGGRSALREAVAGQDVRWLLDVLLPRIADEPPERLAPVAAELRDVVRTSPDRDVVELAMVVLGEFGDEEDAELFRILGRHEELTFYAARALAGVSADPAAEWRALLGHVEGWGRIELIELLLEAPDDETCSVLLRGGFRNTVLNSYTALPVAVGCRLADALAAEPDDALVDGARDILRTLADDAVDGGPDGDMRDYSEAARACASLLVALDRRAGTPADYLAVAAIARFLRRELAAEELEAGGFDEARRVALLAHADRILERPWWPEIVRAALAGGDDAARWEARAVARGLGLPVADALLREIQRDPLSPVGWWEVARDVDDAGLLELAELAERTLPLDEVGRGPAVELWEQGAAQCLEPVVAQLGRVPGHGARLLEVALTSSLVRLRLTSLRAVAEWPVAARPPGVTAALRAGLDEPDDHVREATATVLAGGPMAEPPVLFGGDGDP